MTIELLEVGCVALGLDLDFLMHFDFRFSLFLYECYLDISGFSGWNMIWLSSFFNLLSCLYICLLFVCGFLWA